MFSVLVGNDINNIGNDNSWNNLISRIVEFCDVALKIDDEKKKHFPLLYEEIFLTAAKKGNKKETDLKKFIAKTVSEIQPNILHPEIRSLATNNILTTNYEFTLEGILPGKNDGAIKEILYSVFRHYKIGSKNVWHIHGDCLHPNSINLGFEHYGGQLQQVRNYVATGTDYKSKKILKLPLISRLETKALDNSSWIDLFFTTDMHILGLALEFVETELWWLLTYRARMKIRKEGLIKNRIVYYVPKKYEAGSKNKLDLFRATDVQVVVIDKLGESYYRDVLDRIKKNKSST